MTTYGRDEVKFSKLAQELASRGQHCAQRKGADFLHDLRAYCIAVGWGNYNNNARVVLARYGVGNSWLICCADDVASGWNVIQTDDDLQLSAAATHFHTVVPGAEVLGEALDGPHSPESTTRHTEGVGWDVAGYVDAAEDERGCHQEGHSGSRDQRIRRHPKVRLQFGY